ncbi:hypothetical protein F4780DRAFT_755459 [Xylariomycetidae sp. FL0641]|nr:hypothetical protein F4780DRAFT_755459 [Xylariomycetidae sp. FL0641]
MMGHHGTTGTHVPGTGPTHTTAGTTGSHIPGMGATHTAGTTGSHIPGTGPSHTTAGTTGSHIPGTGATHTAGTTGSHIPGTGPTHTTAGTTGHHVPGTGATHTAAGTTGHHAPGTTGAHVGSGPGPAPHTAGPHKSDVLNKLDPRVDSNLDGSKTIGGNKTGHHTTVTKDPHDAAQVPPSTLRSVKGDPVVEHGDHHHQRDRRHSQPTAQEAYRGL